MAASLAQGPDCLPLMEVYGRCHDLRNSADRRWRKAVKETKLRRERFQRRAKEVEQAEATKAKRALEHRKAVLDSQNSNLRLRAPSPIRRKQLQQQAEWTRHRKEIAERQASEKERARNEATARAKARRTERREQQKELKKHILQQRNIRQRDAEASGGVGGVWWRQTEDNAPPQTSRRRGNPSSAQAQTRALPLEHTPRGGWKAAKAEAGKGLKDILEGGGLEFAEDASASRYKGRRETANKWEGYVHFEPTFKAERLNTRAISSESNNHSKHMDRYEANTRKLITPTQWSIRPGEDKISDPVFPQAASQPVAVMPCTMNIPSGPMMEHPFASEDSKIGDICESMLRPYLESTFNQCSKTGLGTQTMDIETGEKDSGVKESQFQPPTGQARESPQARNGCDKEDCDTTTMTCVAVSQFPITEVDNKHEYHNSGEDSSMERSGGHLHDSVQTTRANSVADNDDIAVEDVDVDHLVEDILDHLCPDSDRGADKRISSSSGAESRCGGKASSIGVYIGDVKEVVYQDIQVRVDSETEGETAEDAGVTNAWGHKPDASISEPIATYVQRVEVSQERAQSPRISSLEANTILNVAVDCDDSPQINCTKEPVGASPPLDERPATVVAEADNSKFYFGKGGAITESESPNHETDKDDAVETDSALDCEALERNDNCIKASSRAAEGCNADGFPRQNVEGGRVRLSPSNSNVVSNSRDAARRYECMQTSSRNESTAPTTHITRDIADLNGYDNNRRQKQRSPLCERNDRRNAFHATSSSNATESKSNHGYRSIRDKKNKTREREANRKRISQCGEQKVVAEAPLVKAGSYSAAARIARRRMQKEADKYLANQNVEIKIRQRPAPVITRYNPAPPEATSRYVEEAWSSERPEQQHEILRRNQSSRKQQAPRMEYGGARINYAPSQTLSHQQNNKSEVDVSRLPTKSPRSAGRQRSMYRQYPGHHEDTESVLNAARLAINDATGRRKVGFRENIAPMRVIQRNGMTAGSREELKLLQSVERLDKLLKTYKRYSQGVSKTVVAMDIWNASMEEANLKAALAQLDCNLRETSLESHRKIDRPMSRMNHGSRLTQDRAASAVRRESELRAPPQDTAVPGSVPRRNVRKNNVGYTGRGNNLNVEKDKQLSGGTITIHKNRFW